MWPPTLSPQDLLKPGDGMLQRGFSDESPEEQSDPEAEAEALLARDDKRQALQVIFATDKYCCLRF